MTTAHDVVADYLAKKAESTKPAAEREAAQNAAAELIDEMPDGFTDKDIRACMAIFAEHDERLTGMTASRRNRAVTKTLNGMVSDGVVKLDGDRYSHVAF